MLNNKDEKYQGPEDSEYHFSDEEVSYEVEPETAKLETAAAPKVRFNLINRLTQSKRMVISLVIFLVLIFVVYKMVAPTSTPTSTQITPAVTVTQNQTKNIQPPKSASNLPVSPPSPPVYNAPNQQITVPTQPANPTFTTPSAMPTTMATTTQETIQPPVVQPPPAYPNGPTNVSNVSPPVAPPQQVPVVQQQPVIQQPVMQPPSVAQLPATTEMQSNVPTQGFTNFNAPVQQAGQQNLPQPMTTQMPVAPPVSVASQVSSNIEAQLATIVTQNQQMMAQLKADYTQKINDFSDQNKTLQDQVVALNTRVAGMEKEINQLVQTLTHQSEVTPRSVRSQAAPAPAPQVRIPYTVQAIIPGRAWLRSDSGETVTVAEGDVIKDLGRVTKIDPYDGIVEINTGSKIISLSYGTGG